MSEKILRLMGRLPGNAPSVSHDSAAKTEEPAAAAAPADVQDKKRIRKAALLKLGAMCAFLGVAVVFMTISWFTMSRENIAKGMAFATDSDKYEIYSDPNGVKGSFYDKHTLVPDFEDDDQVIWGMLAQKNNFGNYVDGAEGIAPDSSGYLTFYVKPTSEEAVTLNFNFELIGYNERMVDGQMKMEPLANNSVAKQFLNGHILLFEKCENGVYSGLIETGEDLKRVLKNKTFAEKDREYQVDIYWIWPKNLSNLIYVDGITASMLCGTSGTDHDALSDYVCENPQYFMKNVTGTLTDTVIKANYSDYGSKYDQADNDIGSGVRYIFLRMTVS